MADRSSQEMITGYLEVAIAAEQHFAHQLCIFADECTDWTVKQIFNDHATETKSQCERLTRRLKALGGQPSGVKSFLASLFGSTPRAAQVGFHEAEKATQDLMMAYAAEASEMAMYEALAAAASAAGDADTELLAREIQQEERTAAERVWNAIGPTARTSFTHVTTGEAMRKAA